MVESIAIFDTMRQICDDHTRDDEERNGKGNTNAELNDAFFNPGVYHSPHSAIHANNYVAEVNIDMITHPLLFNL